VSNDQSTTVLDRAFAEIVTVNGAEVYTCAGGDCDPPETAPTYYSREQAENAGWRFFKHPLGRCFALCPRCSGVGR
jgi:hypothetical protein